MALGFVFILWAVFYALPSGAAVTLDRIVAVVNDEAITWSELYRMMEFDLSRQMRSLGAEEKRRLFEEREMFFLRTMVDMRLQLQKADMLGLTLGDEEINEAIENVKRKYSMDENAFLEALKEEGFGLSEYRGRLAEQIILGKLVAREVTSKIGVEAAEVEDYIRRNDLKPEDLLSYRLLQIFFEMPADEKTRTAKREKAEEVMERLRDGADFSLTASRYSEDAVGRGGGDLGYVKRSSLAKGFLEAIGGIGPGEVSEPFLTERGLHIIKLVGKTGPEDEKGLRESVRERLFEERFQKEYENWMRGLREKSYIEIKL